MRRWLRREQRKHIPADLRAVVFDFDGVFTDNRVVLDQHGNEYVACNRADGLALARLRDRRLLLLVLSSETNPVVAARCRKLGLPFIDSAAHKWPTLRDWLDRHGIAPRQVAYLANDLNDLECLAHVGCGVAVADAYPEVKSLAKIILTTRGGRGAVREFADFLFERIGEQCRAQAG
jgi:N-acylneuraminate cytidylyltransferase